ncbi:MAG: hypothetical protein ACK58T_48095, partial [Phycisphaerae bacterium]
RVLSEGNFEQQTPLEIWSILQRVLSDVWVDTNAPSMLLVTQTGIWPSNEIPLWYDLMRRAHMSNEDVAESPGHLVHAYEREHLLTVAFFAVVFGWQFCLYSAGSCRFAEVSHDGDWRCCDYASA